MSTIVSRITSRTRKRPARVALLISLAGFLVHVLIFGPFKEESIEKVRRSELYMPPQSEIYSKNTVRELMIARPQALFKEEQELVPRGQSFFYTSSESRRLGSFETWRPLQKVRSNLRRIGATAEDIHDNIYLAMHTTTNTMWKNIPTQLLTTLQNFKSFGLYANFADSIGGVEVVDVLEPLIRHAGGEVSEFEPYQILKSIRDSHVNIGPDQISILEMEKLTRFQMLPMLHTVYLTNPNFDWYVIVDDGSTIFHRNLRKLLQTLDSNDIYYLGSTVLGSDYSFANIEAGIILSQGTMRLMFQNYLNDNEKNVKETYEEYRKLSMVECCGDYVLAKFLKERFNIDLNVGLSDGLFQDNSLGNVKVRAQNWCKPIITIGNQRLREMELVADYQDLKETIMYSDIYLDFIKPYLLAGSQINWDNGAQDIEFSQSKDSSTNAHKSLEDCREACYGIQQCLMIRYDAYTKYCGLGISSVALGGPIIHYRDTNADDNICKEFAVQCASRKPDQHMTSEWLIDRIRLMRETLECDSLYEDSLSEGIEFGALDQVEGWWHRAKQISQE